MFDIIIHCILCYYVIILFINIMSSGYLEVLIVIIATVIIRSPFHSFIQVSNYLIFPFLHFILVENLSSNLLLAYNVLAMTMVKLLMW